MNLTDFSLHMQDIVYASILLSQSCNILCVCATAICYART